MTRKSRNRTNVPIVLFILVFVIACSCPNLRDGQNPDGSDSNPSGDSEQSSRSEKPDKGDFVVKHTDLTESRFESIDKQIKDEKVLEKAADKLNRSLSLPHDIPLRTKACGRINAYYDPRDKSITFCYELMEHFFKLYKSQDYSDSEANESMNKAINFVFLHELGHALIDGYELPITANEEDAADRCSSYICIEELGQDGVDSILAAADAFAIESRLSKGPDAGRMADEHLLSEQRFFNSLCMVYGSDPIKYSAIVTKGYLPKARAVRCPMEYERTASSWKKLLQPWRKD